MAHVIVNTVLRLFMLILYIVLSLSQNNGIAQLLAQVTEVERLSKQILQWRSQNSSTSINDITT